MRRRLLLVIPLLPSPGLSQGVWPCMVVSYCCILTGLDCGASGLSFLGGAHRGGSPFDPAKLRVFGTFPPEVVLGALLDYCLLGVGSPRRCATRKSSSRLRCWREVSSLVISCAGPDVQAPLLPGQEEEQKRAASLCVLHVFGCILREFVRVRSSHSIRVHTLMASSRTWTPAP